MSEGFHWDRSGLNHSHFHALANLLSLRNDGQAEPASLSSTDVGHIWDYGDDSDDATDSVDTSAARRITDSGHGKLKRKFLDSLAEIAANKKGGETVACTAMSEGESSVTIWITRNEGFLDADVATFKTIGNLLGSLHRTESDFTANTLWDAMVAYQQYRIEQSYIPDLKDSFKPLKTRSNVMEVYTPESVAIFHGTLAALKKLLFDYQDRGVDVLERHKSIAMAAYEVRQTPIFEHMLNSSPRATRMSRKLWVDTCMLARLRVAFERFRELAVTIPSFEEVNIILVSRPQVFQKPAQPLTLRETFNILHVEFSQATVKAAISQNLTLEKIKRDFGKRQNRRPQVHAEVQLLLHLHTIQLSASEIVPYLGCSKLSCFLCHRFVRSYGRFETRGCHGRAFQSWTVPDVSGIAPGQAEKICKAIKEVQGDVENVLKASVTEWIRLQKTSVAGGSSLLGASSHEMGQKNKQRMIEQLNMKAERERVAEMFRRQTSSPLMKAVGGYSFSQPGVYHSCDICGRKTMNKCSICDQDYFCSDKCEAKRHGSHLFTCSQRPLTSADYLWKSMAEDLMPREPDVLEDFGFNNVLNDREKSMLLGLYQGLRLMGGDVITAEKVHDWRISGTLEDKIKEFYYAIPEESRGGYFPWLLQNPHVLKQPLTEDEAQARLVATYFDGAKSYLDPQDRNKTIQELDPIAKQHCYGLLAMILHRNTPDPLQEIYYSLGFVTCRHSEVPMASEESVLLQIYQLLLIPDDGSVFYKVYNRERGPVLPATFTQFWKAYERGTLIQLMDAKGLKELRSRVPHLEKFLSVPPNGPRPSVWHLKQFIEINDHVQYTPTPSAAVDYGFVNCKTFEERAILMEIYSRLLASVGPLDLHEACVSGRLYDVANEHFPMKEEWRPLMKNLYGMAEEPDIVSKSRAEVKSEADQDQDGSAFFSMSTLWNILGLSGK